MKAATPAATTVLKHARALASVLLDHGDLLVKVESRMTELAGDRVLDPGAEMLHEHLGTGGKRLRARLALAACHALGGRSEYAVDWAAAVELLHNASLIHDDIQDGDRSRRDKPALWARHGIAQAINAGDLLLMLPFRALGGYPDALQSALVQILAEYAEGTARGQIHELALTASSDKGWGDYFSAVSGKTGTLFALPVRGAAELAGLEPDEANNVALTFSSIGVLYQLQDDLLDLFESKGRGSCGSDIYEGRLSAVVLTHLDLHPSDAVAVFEILNKPRDETKHHEVSQMIERFIEGGAAAQLLDRIHLMASGLLASKGTGVRSDIQAVARELVHRVLTPIDALEGGLS
ncbi:MAG: polyprenyl synthetase family protein [Myxococcales bacterium]|nr:polyprenyl synthetase family protein [Myxococcales bacterium]MDH3483011.1 polyprenyl synthetase family protein [Myxococcales bacterium]